MAKKEYDMAIADYNQALKFDPTNAILYMNRGTAYARIGATEKALNDFTKAMELDPNDNTSYFSIAMVYEQLGNYNDAIKMYTLFLQRISSPTNEIIPLIEVAKAKIKILQQNQ